MNEVVLAVDGLAVTFGALRAVDGVSISVARGERRAIIGPNGAGKTTLFNAIAGEVATSAGRVVFDGIDVTRLPPHKRAAIGLTRTFQITNLFASLTVEQNVALAVRGLSRAKFSLFGDARPTGEEAARIEPAIAIAGLDSRRGSVTRELSYGEQRQLELAMALATRPRLLLLDEPAAGLSPAERIGMASAIRNLPRDITLVLIEHDMELALGLVDRVTCMYFGQVLAEDLPSAIRDNPKVQDVYFGRAHA
jgi:branched-chain amino acid transport system ATP-binding protein